MLLLCAVACLAVLSPSGARSVSRHGPSGSVNLVEFNIRGTVYGRCVYDSDEGQEITVLYEERGKELLARSSNPTIIDPVTRALQCRETAAKPPTSTLQGRTDLDMNSRASELELLEQFQDFNMKTQDNMEYAAQLQPRFVGKVLLGLGALGLATGVGNEVSLPQQHQNQVGISFGRGQGPNFGSFFPGIHLMANDDDKNTHTTHSFGQSDGAKVPGLGSILGGIVG